MAAKTSKLIASGSLAALSAPIDITNLSDYSSLRLTVSNDARAAAQTVVRLVTSADNGSSFGSNYPFSLINDGTENRNTSIGLNGAIVSAGQGGGSLHVYNFNVAAPTFCYITRPRADTICDISSNYDADAPAAQNAVRLFATIYNFTAGTWYLTGERAPLEIVQTIAYPQTGNNVVDVTGYASLNIVVIGGSVSVEDLFVGDNGIGVIGDFVINYINEGTTSTVTRTANESRYWSLQDGTSATSFAACMHLTGVDMATPTYCPATSQFANVQNKWTSGFRDSAAAITSLTVTDDNLTTGTLYVTGVPN